jgi:hypothetical protein
MSRGSPAANREGGREPAEGEGGREAARSEQRKGGRMPDLSREGGRMLDLSRERKGARRRGRDICTGE